MTLATIKILESGPYSTIQDIGRKGHQYLGVPEGGISDLISFNIARTQEPDKGWMCISPKEYYINNNKNPPKTGSCCALEQEPAHQG